MPIGEPSNTDQQRPLVRGFYEPRTGSVQYVVSCRDTKHCAIIDPVHDYDEKSGTTATTSADALLDYVAAAGLSVKWILDTHPHADHFSASGYLRYRTGAPTGIGAHVPRMQEMWAPIYNWQRFAADGSQWDRLFHDGDRFSIGALEAVVMHSPGHTLASISYLIENAAFIHDTLFMPDSGTARADFPGGSAEELWHSIERILALPGTTRLFTGHDYRPRGRDPHWESSIADQREHNIMLAGGAAETEFAAKRRERDRRLAMPAQILAALQVNLRGGRLPEPESNGGRYLKIPLDRLTGASWE